MTVACEHALQLGQSREVRESSPRPRFLAANYRDLNHFVSTGIHQWWIQGRGSGAPYFWTKLRPEESKKNFWRPPPPYLRVWMTAPPFPYLKVWIRLCSCHLYILLTTLKGLRSSRHQRNRHQEVNLPLTNNSVIIDVFTHLEVT